LILNYTLVNFLVYVCIILIGNYIIIPMVNKFDYVKILTITLHKFLWSTVLFRKIIKHFLFMESAIIADNNKRFIVFFFLLFFALFQIKIMLYIFGIYILYRKNSLNQRFLCFKEGAYGISWFELQFRSQFLLALHGDSYIVTDDILLKNSISDHDFPIYLMTQNYFDYYIFTTKSYIGLFVILVILSTIKGIYLGLNII
jgi:hypothetical protein